MSGRAFRVYNLTSSQSYQMQRGCRYDVFVAASSTFTITDELGNTTLNIDVNWSTVENTGTYIDTNTPPRFTCTSGSLSIIEYL